MIFCHMALKMFKIQIISEQNSCLNHLSSDIKQKHTENGSLKNIYILYKYISQRMYYQNTALITLELSGFKVTY